MVLVIILAVVLFVAWSWVKKKWYQPKSDSKLPPDFFDNKKSLTWEELMKKKEEQMKNQGGKHRMNIVDEAILRHQIKQNHEALHGPPRMGAFDKADLLRKQREEKLKMNQELEEKIKEYENNAEKFATGDFENDYME